MPEPVLREPMRLQLVWVMARRNFKEYPFMPMMSTEVKLQVERKVVETVGELYGKYHSLSKIDGKVREFLHKLGVSVDR